MSSAPSKERPHRGEVVGDGLSAAVGRWSFGGGTVDSFDSHVERSVPSYRQGHELVVALSDYFVGPGSTVLEVGCSTASLTERLARHHDGGGVSFVGIDIESEMIAKARGRCADLPTVELLVGDALSYQPASALDLVVAYYTVQFISPHDRQRLVDTVFTHLNWGGAFVMFEKVRAPDARFQDILSQLYTDYKLTNGYSCEEIVGKTRSLKGVLEPFSTSGNMGLLARAGFEDVMTVMKTICFEGFLAIK